MGNDGRYEESRKIGCKLLKESLRNRRMGHLVNSQNNELWCQQKMLELNNMFLDRKQEAKMLKQCLILSDLAKLSNWKKFFQHKIEK